MAANFLPSKRERAPMRAARQDVRCHCGSLMARVTTHGIELKCRRCKRVVVVAADTARREWVTIPLHREKTMVR